MSLHARLERDLEKGKIHFVDVEGSNISTESEEGYLENVEIHGNTWQDANNLSDIRSVGTKVEGQELYEIPVLSCGENVFNNEWELGSISSTGENIASITIKRTDFIKIYGSDTVTLRMPKYKKPEGARYIKTYLYDKDKKYLGSHLVGDRYASASFNPITGSEYIKITMDTTITECEFEVFLEQKQAVMEGNILESTPYMGNRITILSPTPLEKVGDVADRIVCKDGVWGVEKNIVSGTFEFSGKWAWSGNSFKYTTLKSSIPNFNETYVVSNVESGLWVNANGNIIRSYSSDDNLDYLNSFSEIYIKYPTTQPTFIPLPHSQQVKLRTFTGRTNISFLTEIEGTIKAQVPKSLGATVSTHILQIDNLNKELDRVKKLEESTVSTVTSDKAFTTVSETSNGYFEDVKIEGKTLVNLATVKNASFEFKTGNPSNGQDINLLRNIKGTHTLIADVKSNTLNKGIKIRINTTDNTSIYPTPIPQGTVGKVALTFDTMKNGVEYDANYLRLYTDNSTSGSVEIDNITILEGDHTDKDITFFEGLKSVGQDSGEIEILSNNINLWDGVFYEDTSINIDGTTQSTKGFVSTDYIKIDAKKDIFVNVIGATNNDAHVYYYRNDKTHITRQLNVNKPDKLDVPTDAQYMRLQFYIAERQTLDNIKSTVVSCGKRETVHTKGLLNKKEILYFNPTTQTWEKPVLREWDSIEKHSDGKYYYHKRSGEVVLNGSENWELHKSVYANHCQFTLPVKGWVHNHILLCDKFQSTIYEIEIDAEKVLIGGSDNVHIRISKSKAQDVQGFKQWLQANNVTVVYQLAKEEIYECTNLDLITYNGETNLIVNSGAIQPRITLKVLSNVSNVVKLLQEKVSVLENKFIEGLKQVLAGDMMSLAHLLYPEDFENNHEIQTLEL